MPLGGFVRLKGEDPNVQEDFNAKDSFIKAKILKKIVILIAGVGMNLIVARMFFTAIFALGTQPISILPENAVVSHQNSYLMPTVNFLEAQGFISGELVSIPAKIEKVSPNLIGQQLGLMSGDTVLSINSIPVDIWNIGTVLKENIGKDIAVQFARKGKKITSNAECPADSCIL